MTDNKLSKPDTDLYKISDIVKEI